MRRELKAEHIGREVFVYRNLTRKCWSVKDVQTGKVLCHLDALSLAACKFQVSETGRRRVLQTGKKTVHAGIRGQLKRGFVLSMLRAKGQVYYNPKIVSEFVDRTTAEVLDYAEQVNFEASGRVYYN